MNKDFDLCAVEYLILDIVFTGVADSTITGLGYAKTDVIPVDAKERTRIISALSDLAPSYIPGGAAANTITAFARMGGKAVFVANCGQDTYGKILLEDLKNCRVASDGLILADEPSGICLILTSQDAERTMFPSVEAGLRLKPEMLNQQIFSRSKWVFAQAYLLPYSEDLRATLSRTIELAKNNNCQLAFSLSAPGIVKAEKENIVKLLKDFDLCFANEFEAAEISGTNDPEASAKFLAKLCPHVVVTAGAAGVWIAKDGQITNIPAFDCQPVDLTGAGDMFAGAYLRGLVQGLAPQDAARAANFLAMKVISNVGARLTGDLEALWLEAQRS